MCAYIEFRSVYINKKWVLLTHDYVYMARLFASFTDKNLFSYVHIPLNLNFEFFFVYTFLGNVFIIVETPVFFILTMFAYYINKENHFMNTVLRQLNKAQGIQETHSSREINASLTMEVGNETSSWEQTCITLIRRKESGRGDRSDQAFGGSSSSSMSQLKSSSSSATLSLFLRSALFAVGVPPGAAF